MNTPIAILLLFGLALVYFALHGWDAKYGMLGGHLSGAPAHG